MRREALYLLVYIIHFQSSQTTMNLNIDKIPGNTTRRDMTLVGIASQKSYSSNKYLTSTVHRSGLFFLCPIVLLVH